MSVAWEGGKRVQVNYSFIGIVLLSAAVWAGLWMLAENLPALASEVLR